MVAHGIRPRAIGSTNGDVGEIKGSNVVIIAMGRIRWFGPARERAVMGERRGKFVVPCAVALGIAVAVAGCSSSPSTTSTTSTTAGSSSTTTGGSTGSTPGVTATAINVGAISTLTGSIASDFNGLAPGVKAYFDMVNAQGGINGRKLVLAYNLDDGGQPSQFTQLTHTLIDQDHAFAVMVASYWFTPNYFVETHTPTYGYNVSGIHPTPALGGPRTEALALLARLESFQRGWYGAPSVTSHHLMLILPLPSAQLSFEGGRLISMQERGLSRKPTSKRMGRTRTKN